MALIGQIRKNMWIVIVLVALGLGGFILQDMFSGQQSAFGSQQTYIGKVDGEKLEWNQFQRDEQIVRDFLYRNTTVESNQLRTQLWNYFIEERIVKEEAKDLGLKVTKDELIDLQFGANLSPVISQRFQDPNTRQVDREQLALIRRQIEDNTMDPSFRIFWAHQEEEVIKERLQSKLNTLVAKAIYTPTWMAEMLNNDQNTTVNLAYVRVPYDDIDNTEVILTDEDFEAYFEKNKEKYRQKEETRKVKYIAFDVEPTAKDSADLREQVKERVQAFAETENDSLFVEANFGIYNPNYITKEELSPVIADTVMNAAPGTVIGPYLDQGAYNAIKVIDRRVVADSADSRHILRQATTPEEFVRAENTIDSLKNLIETGQASFDSLAIKFSQDGGSASQGGKYEGTTPGQFVPEYNEVLFVTGEVGKLYKIRTQFGYHLVEVLRRSSATTPRVKVALIGQPIIPSEETQRSRYDEVYRFIQHCKTIEDMQAAADTSQNLEVVTSLPLQRHDFGISQLGSGQASRDIIRWAFGDDQSMSRPDVGDVSPKIYTYQNKEQFFDSKYVVVGLADIMPQGLPTWQDVRTEIEPQVINSKKAEIITGRINSEDLTAIAANFNTKVDTANNVSFGGGFIPGLGAEPVVIARAFQLTPNSVSQPLEGTSGVFVVKVLNKNQNPAPLNPVLKKQFATTVRSNINSRLVQTMRDNADIEDNRARFY